MEKDVLIAQGSSRTTDEKMGAHSDGTDIYICHNCGHRAIVNESLCKYKCFICGPRANIARVSSTWVANLLFNEMSSMCVEPTFELEPFSY